MRFQLKITLRGARPSIWRRVMLDSNLSLDDLNLVIQEVMPWSNAQLYVFEKDGQEYGNLEMSDDLDSMQDSLHVSISDLLIKPMDSLVYEYDFGVGWMHDVVLEKVLVDGRDGIRAKLIAGKGACPPEDCGGIEEYVSLLEVLKDKNHPEYKSKRKWLFLGEGEEWDPMDWGLDLEEVNEILEELVPVLVPENEGEVLETDELIRFFSDYMKKGDLLNCMRAFQIKNVSRCNKEELAAHLVRVIEEDRKAFLGLFSVPELYRLHHIATSTAGEEIPSCSGVLALLAIDQGGALLRQRVAKTLSDGLEEYLDSDELSERRRIEEILMGLLHLYGVVEIGDLCKQAMKFYRLGYPNQELPDGISSEESFKVEYLTNSLSFMHTSCIYMNKRYLYTPLITDGEVGVERILEVRKENGIKNMASLTVDEVLGAGLSHPALEFRMEAATRFEAFLDAYGVNPDEAKLLGLMVWVAHNNCVEMADIISLLLSELGVSLSGGKEMEREIKGAANGLMEFVNNMPMWELNGATPEAIFRFEAKHPGVFSERSYPETNVGRNDLCPCGSGKKYKKCCGK